MTLTIFADSPLPFCSRACEPKGSASVTYEYRDVDVGQSWVADAVATFGYLGIVVVVAVETAFPPIAGVSLAMIGLTVAAGRFSFLGAVTAATVGSLLGAIALYELGARLGPDRSRQMLVKIKLLSISPESFDRASAWFDRHGSWVVLVGRCVPVVRSLVSIPAGVRRMHMTQFAALTAAGCTAWNIAVIGSSAILGSSWDRLMAINRMAGLMVTFVCVAAAPVLIVRRRRSDQAASSAKTAAGQVTATAGCADVRDSERDEPGA